MKNAQIIWTVFLGIFLMATGMLADDANNDAVAAKFAEEIMGYYNVGDYNSVEAKFDFSQMPEKIINEAKKSDEKIKTLLKNCKVAYWTFGPWSLPPTMQDVVIAGKPNYLLLMVLQNPAKPNIKFRLQLPMKIEGCKGVLIPSYPKGGTSEKEDENASSNLPPIGKELSDVKGISFMRVHAEDSSGVTLGEGPVFKAASASLGDIVQSLVNMGGIIPNEEYIFDGLDQLPEGCYDVTVSPEVLKKGIAGYKLAIDTILHTVKKQYKIEKAEVPVYYLRKIKGEESKLPKASISRNSYSGTGGIGMKFVGRTMEDLANEMDEDRLVFDDTALMGKYDFELPADNEWELKYWIGMIGLKLEPGVKKVTCVKILPGK